MRQLVMGALLASCVILMNAAVAGETVHFVERTEHEVDTHIHGDKDAPGDLLTFADPVFDAANRTEVGSDHGYCVRVVPGKSWECFWTLRTQEGMITVEGPYNDVGDSLLVVTGGTGKYAGAKGQMKLHPRDAKGTSWDFVYELL